MGVPHTFLLQPDGSFHLWLKQGLVRAIEHGDSWEIRGCGRVVRARTFPIAAKLFLKMLTPTEEKLDG